MRQTWPVRVWIRTIRIAGGNSHLWREALALPADQLAPDAHSRCNRFVVQTRPSATEARSRHRSRARRRISPSLLMDKTYDTLSPSQCHCLRSSRHHHPESPLSRSVSAEAWGLDPRPASRSGEPAPRGLPSTSRAAPRKRLPAISFCTFPYSADVDHLFHDVDH